MKCKVLVGLIIGFLGNLLVGALATPTIHGVLEGDNSYILNGHFISNSVNDHPYPTKSAGTWNIVPWDTKENIFGQFVYHKKEGMCTVIFSLSTHGRIHEATTYSGKTYCTSTTKSDGQGFITLTTRITSK